jgi:hypothetical protein
VLHDPPGGASFSAFINTHATTQVYDYDKESEDLDYNLDLAFGHWLAFEQEMGATGPATVVWGVEAKIGPYFSASGGTQVGGGYSADSQAWAGDMFEIGSPTRVYGKQPYAVNGNFDFEFTYATSANPDRAGPASDAFLMPALTFEISEVWVVRMTYKGQTPAFCRVNGRSDKSLSPREDLNAFWWTTANDVETRMLPLLKDAGDEAKHRLDCADVRTNCCKPEDVEQGCNPSKIKTLHLYCDWLHSVEAENPTALQIARDASEGWLTCQSIVDDRWKTKCEEATKPSKKDLAWQACKTAASGSSSCATAASCTTASITPTDTRSCVLGTATPNSYEEPDTSHFKDKDDITKENIKAFSDSVEKPVTPAPTMGCQALCNKPEVKLDVGKLCTKNIGEKFSGFTLTADIPGTDLINFCDVLANQSQTYSSASNPATKAITASGCKTFVRTDQVTRAHDDWYNTLGRNYAKQTKADAPESVASYKTLDSLSKDPKPVEFKTDKFGRSCKNKAQDNPCDSDVKLRKLTGLAPQILMENSRAQDGGAQTDTQKAEYLQYNAMSFEGGGSSIEYTWKPHAASNGNDFTGYDRSWTAFESDFNSFEGGLIAEASLSPGVFFELQIGGGYTHVKVRTKVTTVTDDSRVSFHLEDPEWGDYFLVTVWEDPEYTTPIFSLQGGASSCKWEVNTYHRSAPTMEVDYLGPDLIPPDQPALFKVTIANAIYYYEAGPTDKLRPGWASADLGYDSPSLAIHILAGSLENGLKVQVNGAPFSHGELPFHNFGKGSEVVLVEVHRGAKGFTFSAPVLAFGEVCDGPMVAGLGEKAADAEMGMVGDPESRKIKFIEACPPIAWSGAIQSDGSFVVHKEQPKVDFMVLNPTGSTWKSPEVTKLEFQWRLQGSSINQMDWKPDEKIEPMLPTNADLTAGLDPSRVVYPSAWTPPVGIPDGVYEIRVLVMCRPVVGVPDEYQQSSTSTIRGMVDRQAPEMHSVQTSAENGRFLTTDVITATFTEPVSCEGINPLTGVTFQATFVVTIGSEEFSHNSFRWQCEGATIQLALSPAGQAQLATLPITSTSDLKVDITGVLDAGGNPATVTTYELTIESTLLKDGKATRDLLKSEMAAIMNANPSAAAADDLANKALAAQVVATSAASTAKEGASKAKEAMTNAVAALTLLQNVRCAFFDRNLHSRIPMVPTPARLKLLHACDQCHSSRVPTASYRLAL